MASAVLALALGSALLLTQGQPVAWASVFGGLLVGIGSAMAVGGWLWEQRGRRRLRRLAGALGAERSRKSALEQENRHFQAIVASMSDGVLVTGGGGRVAFTNPAWDRLFLPGQEGTSAEARTRLERLVAITEESTAGHQEEIELPGRRPRTVLLNATPLEPGPGVVVLARDLTGLLQLSEMRRDFVANVSHELRTPLAAIRGFAETLADGALDDARAAPRFVERIVNQCGRLELLLADLLALSSLEHSSAGDDMEPVSLARLLRSARDTIQGRAAEKEISLVVEAETSGTLRGSADALERLCLNLLQNAVSYNRRGGRVWARLTEREGHLVLEVEDTGIGIPAANLERVFERFYRVDKGRSRGEGGTGLGLAIVKHAAQLHGGRVEVESRLREGSVFRVVLPLESGSAARGSAIGSPPSEELVASGPPE